MAPPKPNIEKHTFMDCLIRNFFNNKNGCNFGCHFRCDFFAIELGPRPPCRACVRISLHGLLLNPVYWPVPTMQVGLETWSENIPNFTPLTDIHCKDCERDRETHRPYKSPDAAAMFTSPLLSRLDRLIRSDERAKGKLEEEAAAAVNSQRIKKSAAARDPSFKVWLNLVIDKAESTGKMRSNWKEI